MATSEAGGSETTIEIKIKTLDSQTYTLRVDKQMSVPALKAQIASVTGVLSEEQRLICRGKVLKDDQLLSAYHVEDGHTLHLVVRQPVPPSSGAPVFDPTDSSTSPSHSNDAAPRVVIETFCMPVQGDGMPPEISRIVSAVLNSIGLPEIVNGIDGLDVREHGIADSSAHQPEESGTRGPSDRSHGSIGHQTSVPLGSQPPPVLPDSLTTLSQYVTQIRNEFDVIDTGGRNSPMDESGGRNSSTTSSSGSRQQGLPTPGSLAEVLLSTRQMLVQEVGGSLLQLAAQLENQVNVTDAAARLSTQSNAMRTGVLLHSLGAFFLELGRTVMTLRMGQTPSEAVVNAGPAVFISQSGPNPIMVQPLPFQLGSSLGTIPMGAMQPATAVQGLGTGFMPRRIDIQIRRGSATATDASRDELRGVQQVPGQREPRSSADGETHVNQVSARVPEGPSLGGQSGVRVVPIRTMVATVPAPFSRLSTNSSGNSVGVFYHPVQGRFSQPSLGIASGEEGSQVSGERHPTDPQTDVSSMQQQNIEEPARDGQQGQANTRTINLNIMSSGGAQSNLESQRQIPSSVVQFLSTLFPGGEIHMEETSVQGTTTTSSPSEHATTSSAVPDSQEAEPPRVTDEGIFFSNVLRQIMPHISQQVQTGPDAIALDSSLQDGKSDAGTSRHQSENESDAPSSKRQKME